MQAIMRWTTIGVVTAVLVLTGCAERGEETGEATEPVAEEEARETETPAGTDVAREVPALEGAAETRLAPTGETGVTGAIRAAPTDGKVAVGIRLEGVRPDGRYLARLHEGTCESPGPSEISLSEIVPTADGEARSVTRIDATELAEGRSYLVQVHGTDEAVVACGPLPELVGASR